MMEFAILCVDDEEIVLDSLKEQLRRYLPGDYRIETAENGSEALEVLAELEDENVEVPIIISDQIMPGIKGDDLLATVHQLYPSALKIFLTGQAGLDAVGNAVNKANLYRYIAKPWDETDLHMTIREGLRRYFQEKQIQKQNVLLQQLYEQAQVDIKNLRAAEKELIQAHDLLEDRVEARTQQLQEANLSLQETIGDLNSFAHTVAHDLKSPLSALIGYTDMLLEYGDTMDKAQSDLMLSRIYQTAKKMVTIVHEILLLASVRRESVQLHLVDMSSIAQQAQDRLAHMVTEYGAEIHIDEMPLMAAGYAPWVEEIWVNYISNALKYGGTPPRIRVAGRYIDGADEVEFWVQDNGRGLTNEEVEKIFSEFQRLHRDRAEGNGLGLSIVQRILKKLGGRVMVASEINKGSRFGFALPLFDEKQLIHIEP